MTKASAILKQSVKTVRDAQTHGIPLSVNNDILGTKHSGIYLRKNTVLPENADHTTESRVPYRLQTEGFKK